MCIIIFVENSTIIVGDKRGIGYIFVFKLYMDMDTNVSTVDNPLRFFRDYFPLGFDKRFGNFFKMSTDEYVKLYNHQTDEVLEVTNPCYMIECNEKEDYIVYVDAVLAKDRDDVKHQHKKHLPTQLFNVLKPELEKSIQLTDDAIYANLGAEKALLDNLLSNMALIIDREVPKISLPKYIPLCTTILRSYISEIETKYSRYISRNKSTYLKYLTPKNAVVNHSLNMKPDKLKDLGKLLQMLKEEEFVEKNLELPLFRKAFDNTLIKEPLGIKWIKWRKGDFYIGSLAIMIDLLEEKEYISKYRVAQLIKIFEKGNGEPIGERGWYSAKSDAKSSINDPENEILDSIKKIIGRF